MGYSDKAASPVVYAPVAGEMTLEDAFIASGKLWQSLMPGLNPVYECYFDGYVNPGSGQAAVWYDKNGVARLSQATDANKPTLTATGLAFDGTSDYMTFVGAIGGDRTVLFCCSHKSGTDIDNYLLGNGPSAATPFYFGYDDNAYGPRLYALGSPRYSAGPLRPDIYNLKKVFALRQKSTTPFNSLRVAGVESSFPAGVAFDMRGNVEILGCAHNAATPFRFFGGEIQALIVFDAYLTDTQVATAEAELTRRFGAV